MVEIPIGTTLRKVVFDIGGGVLKDREFKAVQIGGPSGGCVPAKYLDIPIDYDSLTGIGAIMGSGGMIVMDEKTCIVDIARYFMEFVQNESCGKCVPCRLGTEQMLDILTRITQGQGKEEAMVRIKEKTKEILASNSKEIYSQKIRQKQLKEMDLLIDHYRKLLEAEGKDHASMVKNVYHTRENYHAFLARLKQAEKEVNIAAQQMVKVATASDFVSKMEKATERIRAARAEKIFSPDSY